MEKRDSGYLRNAINGVSSLAIAAAENGDIDSGIFLQQTALDIAEECQKIEIMNCDEINLQKAIQVIAVMNKTLELMKVHKAKN